MGVRNSVPDSIAFAVTLLADGRPIRVEIFLDLRDRVILVPARLLPVIGDRLSDFTEQLGTISASVLARQKWDGADPLTEYQPLHILPNYLLGRWRKLSSRESQLRFSILLEEGLLLPVVELDERSTIRLGRREINS